MPMRLVDEPGHALADGRPERRELTVTWSPTDGRAGRAGRAQQHAGRGQRRESRARDEEAVHPRARLVGLQRGPVLARRRPDRRRARRPLPRPGPHRGTAATAATYRRSHAAVAGRPGRRSTPPRPAAGCRRTGAAAALVVVSSIPHEARISVAARTMPRTVESDRRRLRPIAAQHHLPAGGQRAQRGQDALHEAATAAAGADLPAHGRGGRELRPHASPARASRRRRRRRRTRARRAMVSRVELDDVDGHGHGIRVEPRHEAREHHADHEAGHRPGESGREAVGEIVAKDRARARTRRRGSRPICACWASTSRVSRMYVAIPPRRGRGSGT